jgi:hypothetical protein
MPLGSAVSESCGVLENALVRLADVQRELPGRLEVGLVEAGKSAARVQRFELGEQVWRPGVFTRENAGDRVRADFALVDDVNFRRPGGKRGGQAERDEVDAGRFDGRELRVDGGLLDGEIAGIQPDQRGRLVERDVDIDDARKGSGPRHSRHVGGVARGTNIRAEAQLGSVGGQQANGGGEESEGKCAHG